MRAFSVITLAISIMVSALLIGQGLAVIRQPVRLVTVKGLAEREVKADLALWPLRFVRTGNDLQDTQNKVNADEKNVMNFLLHYGLNTTAVASRSTEVTDRDAQMYNNNEKSATRFIVTRTIMLRSADVGKVAEAWQASSELLNVGVVISRENQSGEPVYLFNGLNQLKPVMIAAATKNAKAAAQQFAQDSGSSLSEIQSADQGVFEILPRDKANFFQQEQQIDKTLRVVVTMKYRLKNASYFSW